VMSLASAAREKLPVSHRSQKTLKLSMFMIGENTRMCGNKHHEIYTNHHQK